MGIAVLTFFSTAVVAVPQRTGNAEPRASADLPPSLHLSPQNLLLCMSVWLSPLCFVFHFLIETEYLHAACMEIYCAFKLFFFFKQLFTIQQQQQKCLTEAKCRFNHKPLLLYTYIFVWCCYLYPLYIMVSFDLVQNEICK